MSEADELVPDNDKANTDETSETETLVSNEEANTGFGRMIEKIWPRKDKRGATEVDQEKFVRQTFKELIIYLVFLIFVCIISFGMASVNMYFYTQVMKALFVESKGNNNSAPSFEEIGTINDFWEYAVGPLHEGLYWRQWYNSKTSPPFHDLIYYENLLVGVPRISYLSVEEKKCTVAPEFKNYITECYAEYSKNFENKKNIDKDSIKNLPNISGNRQEMQTNQLIAEAWTYKDELKGIKYWGRLGTYPSRGYSISLKTDKVKSEQMLKLLKKQLWIRRGARVVFVDFTTYNGNLNLFCIVRLSVEFPPTGGAIPKSNIYTCQLIRYFTTSDKAILACEIVFLLFILFYIVEEFIEVTYVGFHYFYDFWNMLDATLILTALTCVGLNIFRYYLVNKQLEDLNLNDHLSFSYIGQIEGLFNNFVSILVFICWVKVFKYISFNKTMTQLSTTLSRCAKDLLGFFIMFTIVFIAFTQLGFLLFGTLVKDFSTFANSFFTLFRIILGDFNFHQLEDANRVLGPAFFMLFVFFVFFVLINMFLAIINDTYSEVKADMAKQVDVFIMSDYIMQTYDNFMTKITSPKEKIDKLQVLVKKDPANTKPMHFDEFKSQLIDQGFDEEEIKIVFDNYDTDGDQMLDPEEQTAMYKSLEMQAAKMKAEEDDEDKALETVDMDDFMVLVRRVDRMEGIMASVIVHIDAVLAELAHL